MVQFPHNLRQEALRNFHQDFSQHNLLYAFSVEHKDKTDNRQSSILAGNSGVKISVPTGFPLSQIQQ
jgi:hypothetical protein